MTAAADARGYIIVYPADAETYDGATFYATGPISSDTLVVVAEPDGTLPGGTTEADIAAMIATSRSDRSFSSQGSLSPLLLGWPYAALSSGWSGTYNYSPAYLAGPGGVAYYNFDVEPSTSQTNAGQGLGYYRGYNGTTFGLWAAWYGLTAATSSSTGGGTTPWDNVSAYQKFHAKCAKTTACSGRYW
jgi:hypothetical protein